MVVLVTCKTKEEPIKHEEDRVVTRLFIIFFRCSRAANSVVGDGILMKFKLIQAFMFVLVTQKNEEDSRNEFQFWKVHGIMNISGLLQSK